MWGVCLWKCRVSLLSVTAKCLVHCQKFNKIYIVHVTRIKYIQSILDLCQQTLSTAEREKIYATIAICTLELSYA
jgi:hypothetical protein